MKYQVVVNIMCNTEADADLVYDKAKAILDSAAFFSDTTNKASIKKIKSYHDETPISPCELLKSEEK
jgi:hypothetical protein